jgi:hypothetical protein
MGHLCEQEANIFSRWDATIKPKFGLFTLMVDYYLAIDEGQHLLTNIWL